MGKKRNAKRKKKGDLGVEDNESNDYEEVKKEKRWQHTERQTWMWSEIHPLHGNDEHWVLGDCVTGNNEITMGHWTESMLKTFRLAESERISRRESL